MRNGFILLALLLWTATPASAEVHIGINVSFYPQLEMVPGYPVYYAPELESNYFFYDGAYWVYQDDNWYSSSWYNGPWEFMEPEYVPLFVLRVPVRYYRRPPVYFRGWRSDAPPRWDDHWGHRWSQQRSGWDRWDRRAAPAPAPLPVYQRQYSGNRYPQANQQRALQSRNYHYQAVDEHRGDRGRPQQSPQRSAPTMSAPPRQQQQHEHQQPQREQRQHEERQHEQQQQAAQPPRGMDRPNAPARSSPQQSQPERPQPAPRTSNQEPRPQDRQHQSNQQDGKPEQQRARRATRPEKDRGREQEDKGHDRRGDESRE